MSLSISEQRVPCARLAVGALFGSIWFLALALLPESRARLLGGMSPTHVLLVWMLMCAVSGLASWPSGTPGRRTSGAAGIAAVWAALASGLVLGGWGAWSWIALAPVGLGLGMVQAWAVARLEEAHSAGQLRCAWSGFCEPFEEPVAAPREPLFSGQAGVDPWALKVAVGCAFGGVWWIALIWFEALPITVFVGASSIATAAVPLRAILESRDDERGLWTMLAGLTLPWVGASSVLFLASMHPSTDFHGALGLPEALIYGAFGYAFTWPVSGPLGCLQVWVLVRLSRTSTANRPGWG